MYDTESYARNILGQEPGNIIWRSLDFGPNKGREVPTIAFMDSEFDPVFVQFDEYGFMSLLSMENRWSMLSQDDVDFLWNSFEEAARMWKEDIEEKEDG